jgi:hypothetical protein
LVIDLPKNPRVMQFPASYHLHFALKIWIHLHCQYCFSSDHAKVQDVKNNFRLMLSINASVVVFTLFVNIYRQGYISHVFPPYQLPIPMYLMKRLNDTVTRLALSEPGVFVLQFQRMNIMDNETE